MARKINLAVMALATSVVVAGSGVALAVPRDGGPGQVQVAEASQPVVTDQHGAMMTVRQGGVDYLVHRDPSNGRLKLCTPRGKQVYLR